MGDWDEAGFVTQRFSEQCISPPVPDDNYPYVQYDSWSYGYDDTNETTQMAALDVAIELGLEVFVLDLGWAQKIGDWVPDPVKFPRGLAPLVSKAHANGIKFGLHLPLAQADMTSNGKESEIERGDCLVM
jgi:alpha-galactosidase